MHQHDEQCGCGGHHHGCGHPDHPHDHGENCGCGHIHAPIAAPEGMSSIQLDILLSLRQRGCLPVASFSLTKADDSTRHAVALAPVYLSDPNDSMERAKQVGNALSGLENMNLLTLDYDIPLRNYAYAEYKTSELYAYFVKTVEEAVARLEIAFDTPVLELGSMALTEEGEKIVNSLLH